jgi:periplasmic nitrate reductase NapE
MPDRDGGQLSREPVAVPTRSEELRTFLFLTVFLAPAITVICIGAYGFLVWMAQLALGPPTH